MDKWDKLFKTVKLHVFNVIYNSIALNEFSYSEFNKLKISSLEKNRYASSFTSILPKIRLVRFLLRLIKTLAYLLGDHSTLAN